MLLLLAALSLGGDAIQSQSRSWILYSIEVPQNVGCSPAPVRVEHRWVQNGVPDVHRQVRELEAELERHYGRGNYRTTTTPMVTGRRAVALVRTTVECRDAAGRVRIHPTWRHVVGVDEADVQRKAAAAATSGANLDLQWIAWETEVAARAKVLANRRAVSPVPEREQSLVETARRRAEDLVRKPAPDLGRPWTFVGFAIGEKNGCVNDPRTRHASAWVYGGPNYDADLRRAYQDVTNDMGRKPYDKAFRVTRGKPIAIALVRAHYRCVRWDDDRRQPPVTSYDWVSGPTRAAVEAELDRRRSEAAREKTGEYSIEVEQWIDVESEIRRLDEQLKSGSDGPASRPVGAVRG